MLIPRKYPRFAVHFPITFHGDRDGEGMVSNLSMDGCHVLSNTIVERKDYLTVWLYHSSDKPPIKIDVAGVRWLAKTRFGLQFLSISPTEQNKLSQFLERLQSE